MSRTGHTPTAASPPGHGRPGKWPRSPRGPGRSGPFPAGSGPGPRHFPGRPPRSPRGPPRPGPPPWPEPGLVSYTPDPPWRAPPLGIIIPQDGLSVKASRRSFPKKRPFAQSVFRGSRVILSAWQPAVPPAPAGSGPRPPGPPPAGGRPEACPPPAFPADRPPQVPGSCR